MTIDFSFPPHAPSELSSLAARASTKLATLRHGDLTRWLGAIARLPRQRASMLAFDQEAPLIGRATELTSEGRAQLELGLQELRPWRKGPFSLFGVELDAEWRCSLKWRRLAPHIDFENARVLDVGCGNGYYCLRALGAGAQWVLDVDPSWLSVVQFAAIARFIEQPAACVLPFALEELDESLAFDVILSMGVLYHRREPLEHLRLLRCHAKPGATVLIESLVVRDETGLRLSSAERYAGMRNVWHVPALATLQTWIDSAGFEQSRIIDVTETTVVEQRVTDYSAPHSLAHVLDQADPTRTIEGHPRPLRAMVIARNPG